MQNKQQGQFINGKWQGGKGDAFHSINPANQKEIWNGYAASAEQVIEAYQSARAAFEEWSQTDLQTRLECVKRFESLAIENKDKLAALIAVETGKIWWDAAGEAGVIAAKVGVSVKAYEERTGHKSFETGFGRAELRHRAHGVMAILGPYNFPAHLPNGQIIPALLAGNTVVYKPSEQCPMVGEFMANLYAQAGFPKGVFNMVQGGRDIGAALLDHDELDGVLFTGSANTGAFIHKKFAGRPEIILALEMGGNNPLLVWDIADTPSSLKACASMIVQSAFITAGQRCTCARRILIEKGGRGDKIIEAVTDMVDQMIIADDPTDTSLDAFFGPVISADIASFIVKQVDALQQAGAKIIRPAVILDKGPAFVSPAILDVTGLDVADEEIFGPVMQIIRVDSLEHGIELANKTRFGLSAGLISDKRENWDVFSRKIRAGVVNFNRSTTGASGALPFGGPGASGNHSPGAYYAADFCAWPIASQISDTVSLMPAKGLVSE